MLFLLSWNGNRWTESLHFLEILFSSVKYWVPCFENLFLGFTDYVAYVNEVFIITLTFDAGFGFIDLHFEVINYF